MKKSAFAAIILVVLTMTACGNHTFKTFVNDNFQLDNGYLYYENSDDGKVYQYDLATGSEKVVQNCQRLFETDGKLYLYNKGTFTEVSDTESKEIGNYMVAEDGTRAWTIVGVVDKTIYYVDWADICLWNYETGVHGRLYRASQSIYDSQLVMADDGIYFIDQGLCKFSFEDGSCRKLVSGKVEDIKLYDGCIYYSVGVDFEVINNQDGKDTYVYSHADLYKLEDDGALPLVTIEHVDPLNSRFTIAKGCIWMLDDNCTLWQYNIDDRQLSGIPLGGKYSTTCNTIISDDRYVIWVDLHGTEAWQYDMVSRTVEKLDFSK